MVVLTERYADQIQGVLSCFDRVVITGTLPEICHAQAMSRFLTSREVRLFDYTQWAEPLREEIRQHAERVAAEAGLTIEFIRRRDFRKEDRVQGLLRERGDHPGLVHIFSAMEACPSFKPWYDKTTGKTSLRGTEAKCLHYTSTSSIRIWASVICGCPPGHRFACSFISTGTTCWLGN